MAGRKTAKILSALLLQLKSSLETILLARTVTANSATNTSVAIGAGQENTQGRGYPFSSLNFKKIGWRCPRNAAAQPKLFADRRPELHRENDRKEPFRRVRDQGQDT